MHPDTPDAQDPPTKDAYGNTLVTGDTVKLTKDLKVKGTSTTLKSGQTIKKIRLTDNPEEIDCAVEGVKMTLKTSFLKIVKK